MNYLKLFTFVVAVVDHICVFIRNFSFYLRCFVCFLFHLKRPLTCIISINNIDLLLCLQDILTCALSIVNLNSEIVICQYRLISYCLRRFCVLIVKIHFAFSHSWFLTLSCSLKIDSS